MRVGGRKSREDRDIRRRRSGREWWRKCRRSWSRSMRERRMMLVHWFRGRP
jgi:hypothetical protein